VTIVHASEFPTRCPNPREDDSFSLPASFGAPS
jgi:hypothetical protein